jgi:hypothetical protein
VSAIEGVLTDIYFSVGLWSQGSAVEMNLKAVWEKIPYHVEGTILLSLGIRKVRG